MFTGIPLNDFIRSTLFDIAQKMFSEKSSYCEVKNVSCEGYVSTSWKHTGVGSTYGILFSAFLGTNKGDTTVEYIVRPTDIKGCDLTWLDEVPFPKINLN